MRVTKKPHLHKVLSDMSKTKDNKTPAPTDPQATAAPPVQKATPPAEPLERAARTSPLDVQLQPDVPAPTAGRSASVHIDPGTRARLLGLVKTTAAATNADIEAVLQELVHLPSPALALFERYAVKVVVCHDSITEHMPELAGVKPRGWPPGATWDDVPGLHRPGAYEVVVATEIKRDRTVLHELGHAFDYVTGLTLRESAAFVAARQADASRLPSYFQGDAAGAAEETFGESFAMYLLGDRTWPHLFQFWDQTLRAGTVG